MSPWYDDADELGDVDGFDPLRVERSLPIGDDEAELLETLCQAATPGPLLIDDEAREIGTLVASLPDGRHIISQMACPDGVDHEYESDANAQLICQARYLILRLLRDREHWHSQRESLLQRMRTLEPALECEGETDRQDKPAGPRSVSPRPR